VVWTPPKLDESWYDALSEEIDQGGIPALHHYLLTLPLGGFKPWTRPPMTTAKDHLIDINRESVDRFIAELERGEIDDLPLCPAGSADMYAAYLRWCRREGVRFPRESNQFAGYLLKQPGWQRITGDRYETTYYQGPAKRQRMFMPSDDLLEDAAARGPGHDYRKPGNKTRTQWLTDCFFAFRAGLNKSGYEGDAHG
jgi:putative DNA primase/helicase